MRLDLKVVCVYFHSADLANLVNEAALLAARAGKDVVSQNEFVAAVERSIGVLIFFFFWSVKAEVRINWTFLNFFLGRE